MSGSLLVVISDTHIGSSTALSPLRYVVHNRSDQIKIGVGRLFE